MNLLTSGKLSPASDALPWASLFWRPAWRGGCFVLPLTHSGSCLAKLSHREGERGASQRRDPHCVKLISSFTSVPGHHPQARLLTLIMNLSQPLCPPSLWDSSDRGEALPCSSPVLPGGVGVSCAWPQARAQTHVLANWTKLPWSQSDETRKINQIRVYLFHLLQMIQSFTLSKGNSPTHIW